jgi:NAD(P)-dependent dehydrogenase (short-subunit alcohol dehydrogenase family)
MTGTGLTRVALITGAGRGLGKVMTLALLRQGLRVVLTSTDLQSLQDTITESGAPPTQARALAGDLSIPQECTRVAQDALRIWGRIDILVNNAGLGTTSIRANLLENPFKFWEVDRATFERFFEVNSTAPYFLAALLAPQMVSRGWGRIVNNTTSLDTMLRFAVYGGSKAALEAHTASMAIDLDGTGVTANVLVPGGGAATRMVEGLGLPMESFISPEVMAAPMVWLASDASDGVTGRRFIARDWDPALPPDQAAEISGAPVAWTGFGSKGSHPAKAMK